MKIKLIKANRPSKTYYQVKYSINQSKAYAGISNTHWDDDKRYARDRAIDKKLTEIFQPYKTKYYPITPKKLTLRQANNLAKKLINLKVAGIKIIKKVDIIEYYE